MNKKKIIIIICSVIGFLCIAFLIFGKYAEREVKKTREEAEKSISEYNSEKEANASFNELDDDICRFVGTENFYSVICVNYNGVSKITCKIDPITYKSELALDLRQA